MRIAVLGCGSIGRRHLRNLHAMGEHELLAYDPVPAAAEAAEREVGVQTFTNLADIWAQAPTIALIAAPPREHLQLATEAAKRRCHLFIEKPLSYTLVGLSELKQAVQDTQVYAMVGCNMRFHPGPVTMKRLIAQGTIGTVLSARFHTGSYLPEWRPWQNYRTSYSASPTEGGAILDCIHEIDLALWLFGPAHLLAAAHQPAASIGLEVDGLAELLLRHEQGSLSSIHLNFIQRDYHRGCTVIGSTGTLYWDFQRRSVEVAGAIPGAYTEPAGWEVNRMYVDELEHFMSCVQAGRSPTGSLDEAEAALRIALAARASTQRSTTCE